ncbi:MAG: hypothetical protein GY847_12760 [Proteobacteria bacterium]|nr:hypothetical protein [Pseudomonadota bacterium]
MGFKIYGKVRNIDTGSGVAGVKVQVMDKDLFFNDLLGEVVTHSNGLFQIEYHEETSRDLFKDQPDVYLVVRTDKDEVIGTTKEDIQFNVEKALEVNIDISHTALVEAGLADPKSIQHLDPECQKTFTTWTWRLEADDEVAAQLKDDLANHSSVLDLVKSYINELKGNADNDALPFIKLARLFELGITPDCVEGHFYGVPVGIRTGDLEGPVAEFGNMLGFLWGTTMQGICPWVGKSFSPIQATKRDDLTQNALTQENQAYLGINHFNRIDLKPLNVASFYLLNWWMGLKTTSEAERTTYGHERNGGNFVAYKTQSVYHGTEREVFQLNYRFKNLDNPPPFRWLIDEIVQVADGLYLGQLLFATKRLQSDYDPSSNSAEYHYQHFGYFLLFNEMWNPEARRLLSNLEMPVIAPGLRPTSDNATKAGKFTTFTFSDLPRPNADDAILTQIDEEMRTKPTIMHLFKNYSDILQDNLDNTSPYFPKLQEIFNRGAEIETLQGRFFGALVTWYSEGLTRFLDLNTLNLAWMRIGRSFSTWTGKTFESMTKAKINEFTDGHEAGDVPTVWGSNTQALRTQNEKFVGKLMKLADVWSEKVPGDEAREFGYDLKNFFFIARKAKSVNPHNEGKNIFQFNYRWPKLKTIIPDCYCIDELVQIADGLYLGQLMYATELLKTYDPFVDPADYKYRLFGYFLLMDDAWQQVRLDIGFDLGNV